MSGFLVLEKNIITVNPVVICEIQARLQNLKLKKEDILHVVNVYIRGKALAENFCQGFFIAKIEFQCYNQNGMYVR